jgi:2-oxo-4-hydroxy-4-carboxy--5-ureidoimidazoline (OHCU) decarboxylase
MNMEEFWAQTALNMIVVAQMGNILIRIFNSSTWVTVQSFHGSVKDSLFRSADEITAALSRNLHKREVAKMLS